jgi:hypothetical protein
VSRLFGRSVSPSYLSATSARLCPHRGRGPENVMRLTLVLPRSATASCVYAEGRQRRASQRDSSDGGCSSCRWEESVALSQSTCRVPICGVLLLPRHSRLEVSFLSQGSNGECAVRFYQPLVAPPPRHAFVLLRYRKR